MTFQKNTWGLGGVNMIVEIYKGIDSEKPVDIIIVLG